MPSVSQKSPPVDDYDSYQPCFFESEFEDDFYQDIPIPSDDIWKKFELLPTPPRSPRRDEDPLDDPTMEQLVRVSDILDCVELHECHSDIDKTRTVLSPAAVVDNCEKCSQKMKSNLIQDCMWSTTWTCKLGMNTDTSKKTKSCDSQVKASVHSSNCQESISKSRCSNSSSPTSFTSVDIPNVSTECVDPTAVFPFAASEDRCTHGLGTETPSDSEEEIDVVTVGEKKQQQLSRVASSPQLHQHLQRTSPRSIISRKNFAVLKAANSGSTPVVSSACSATVAAMHNYTQPKDAEPTKLSLVITRSTDNHHNYGVKRTLSSDSNGLRHIPSKKLRRTFSSRSSVSHGYHHSPPSSRSSSDSEDCVGKRSQHNDMERKRRIDLKYSFQKLRDQVPELHKMERAPKVTILKKAGDYIHQLRHNETALMSELKKQKERKEELSRKLATLRKCTWF